MTTFTISVSDELKTKMDIHSDINWAEYLKKKFEERIKELEKFNKLKNEGKI